jgi:hypothetical protein
MNKLYLSQLVSKSQDQMILVLVVVLLTAQGIGNYGFADDYTFLINFNGQLNPLYEVLLGNGRPFYFWISKIQFSMIEDISGFWILHLLSSIIFFLILNEMNLLFRTFKMGRNERYVLVLLPMLISPAILEFVFWIQLFPALIGIFVSIYAARKIIERRGSATSVIFYFLLGTPFLIYQTIALFSICVLFVVFCFYDLKDTLKFDLWRNKKQLLKNFVAFAVGPLVSLVLIIVGKQLGWVSGDRSELVSDFSEKLEWLQSHYWNSANTIFTPFVPIPAFVSWVSLIVAVALVQFALKRNFKKRIWLFPISIILSALPSFLTSQNWASFRSVALTQLILLLFYSCALITFVKRFTQKSFKTFTLLSIVSALVIGQSSVDKYWISPNQAELSLIRTHLTKTDCKKVKYFKVSHWSQTLTGKVYYDEYSLPSSVQPWSAKDLITLICKEKGVAVGEVLQSLSPTDTENLADKEYNLIDFEDILNQYKK